MTTKSMAAPGGAPQRVSAQYVSAAGLTTPVVSSKRISRDRHATERDRDSDADDRLVRQVCLLFRSNRQRGGVANSFWVHGHVRVLDDDAHPNV
jgi:hypothetical protein